MSARDVILDRLRRALDDGPTAPEIPRDYHRTAPLDPAAVVALLAERIDEYRAHVHRVDPTTLTATIADIVARDGQERLGIPDGLDPRWLDALGDDIEVVVDDQLPAAELDRIDVVVTGAAVAIAETGTVVLDGSGDQGRRALTLVPDHHVCVVQAADVVATVPEALERLDPVRPLTMISGPSATSDIELDRVEGVHGPRTLDVIIVDG